MARVAYTDLFLDWTPTTSGVPLATQVTTLITNYYKMAYGIVYGAGNYNATDSDTTDPQTIIRSDEFFGDLVGELSTKVQQWHDAGISSTGDIIKMPSFKISKELKDTIRGYMGKKTDIITSIRVWGHEEDEGEMI